MGWLFVRDQVVQYKHGTTDEVLLVFGGRILCLCGQADQQADQGKEKVIALHY